MFWRRKNHDYGDVTTCRLLSNGVYAFGDHDFDADDRSIRLRDRKMIAGMWYVFVLSILLWWLPVFGQMITGYLGGRKAGSAIRGIIVTMIPCFIILLILVLVDFGILPSLGSATAVPVSVISNITAASPQAGTYIAGIYNSLLALMGLNGNGIVIIIVFGILGGMMADVHRKEIAESANVSPFLGGFMGRFQEASLGKLADMVAERVLWTLSSIDHGGRALIGKMHHEPTPFGFSGIKRLPPAGACAPQPRLREWVEPEPRGALVYEAPDEEDPGPVILEGVPPLRSYISREPRRIRHNPYESERRADHWDVSGDSMTQARKKPTRTIGRSSNMRASNPRAKRSADRITVKPEPKKEPKVKAEEKRDAVVYDRKGKEIAPKKSPGKESEPPQKKQPSIVARALAADSETKASDEPKQKLEEEKAEKKPKKEKPVQNYEML